jgi:hypothetical protein
MRWPNAVTEQHLSVESVPVLFDRLTALRCFGENGGTDNGLPSSCAGKVRFSIRFDAMMVPSAVQSITFTGTVVTLSSTANCTTDPEHMLDSENPM